MMLNGNALRGLKDLLAPLVAAGNLPQSEANNISVGIDVFAELLDRNQVEFDQAEEQHYFEAAALRAFEALLPYRVQMDGSPPTSEAHSALAVEACDAAAALAAEVKRRKPQRETLPPRDGPSELELQELFGRKGMGHT